MTDISSKINDRDHHALVAWNHALVGPLARTLALGMPHMVGFAAIGNALARGAWKPTREDLSENAVLAALVNQDLDWKDPITNTYDTGLREPLQEDLQQLCLRLVEMGCSPRRGLVDLGGITPLDLAVMLNAHMLIERHADPKWYFERTIDGLPWLHAAARGGCLEVMEALLDQGVGPNLRDANGTTALFHASNPATVELLRARGADPSCLDHGNLDALSYWRGRRNATVERVTGLKKALGRTKIATGDAAMSQFVALVGKCTPSQLQKERRRLKMVGNEWQGAANIASLYIDRIAKDLNSLSSTDASRRRVEQIAGWEEALGQASPVQLGKLAACALVVDMRDTQNALLHRIPVAVRADAERDAWMELLQIIPRQQARNFAIAESVLASAMPLSHQAQVLVEVFTQKVSYPSSPLLELFAAIPAPVSDPGWSTPGLSSVLLQLCTCDTTIAAQGVSKEAVSQARLRQVVIARATDGVSFAPALEMLSSSPMPPEIQQFVDQMQALDAAQRLAHATPPVVSASRGPRL